MLKPDLSLTKQGQQGMVLVIGMIMLLLLTLLVLAGTQTSTLEEKMAGNQQERHKALQAAEAAALYAWTTDLNAPLSFDLNKFINNAGEAGLYDLRPTNTVAGNKLIADWNAISASSSDWPWSGGNQRAVLPNKITASDPMKLAITPQYAIGMYPPILRKGHEDRKCIPFSIIGAGQGSSSTTRTLIELKAIPRSSCFRDPVN